MEEVHKKVHEGEEPKYEKDQDIKKAMIEHYKRMAFLKEEKERKKVLFAQKQENKKFKKNKRKRKLKKKQKRHSR